MKYVSILILAFFSLQFLAQHDHPCAKSKQQFYQAQFQQRYKKSAAAALLTHEMNYDMKFVHLDLQVERNTKTMGGNARMIAKVTSATLDTFMILLHNVMTVDSIYFNGSKVSYIRQDSMVKAAITPILTSGATFTSQVFYNGTPPTGGGAIGSGFSNGTSGSWGNQATWSLSESFVAYHWWPSKQVLTDKIDSSWVFITTDSTNMAGSNGLLTNVVNIGNKKRFEWKSRYPIDYYLISVAVAKYKEYNLYAKPKYFGNDSILIQNFIYDNAINNPGWITQKNDLDKLPQQLEFLSEMYGMYPFHKEKYGNCMAPFSGGMEHQTMTSQGFFDYYINAHELGHQWWGDNVTCRSWGDIWINEGFASYTEHLVAEYMDPLNFHPNLYNVHSNVMSQPGGSVFFTNNDTMNTSRIFSGRLTYNKGGAIIHSLRFLTNNDSLWFNTLRGFQNAYKDSTASAVDFQNYYQAQTSINPSVFFNQWYYGQGYPTFNVKYNYNGSQVFIRTNQTTSMPSATPLFNTPLEYAIGRNGKADTVVRVLHSQAVENYTFAIPGIITGIVCDPNNWLINKESVARDFTLGIVLNPVGIQEQDQLDELRIGPNPTQDKIVIHGNSTQVSNIEIFDLRGRLVMSIPAPKENVIFIPHLSTGVYLVRLLDEHGLSLLEEKVIKQ